MSKAIHKRCRGCHHFFVARNYHYKFCDKCRWDKHIAQWMAWVLHYVEYVGAYKERREAEEEAWEAMQVKHYRCYPLDSVYAWGIKSKRKERPLPPIYDVFADESEPSDYELEAIERINRYGRAR